MINSKIIEASTKSVSNVGKFFEILDAFFSHKSNVRYACDLELNREDMSSNATEISYEWHDQMEREEAEDIIADIMAELESEVELY